MEICKVVEVLYNRSSLVDEDFQKALDFAISQLQNYESLLARCKDVEGIFNTIKNSRCCKADSYSCDDLKREIAQAIAQFLTKGE